MFYSQDMFGCVGTPVSTAPEQTSGRTAHTPRNETPTSSTGEQSKRALPHYFPRILPGQRQSHHRSASSVSSMESSESAYHASHGNVNRESRTTSARRSETPVRQKPKSPAMQTRKALGKLVVEPKKTLTLNSTPSVASNDSSSRAKSQNDPSPAGQKPSSLHSHVHSLTKAKRAIVIPSEMLPPQLRAVQIQKSRNPEEEPSNGHFRDPDEYDEEESSSFTAQPPIELLDKLLEQGLKLKSKYKQLKTAYQDLQQQSQQQAMQARERYQQLQTSLETQLREQQTKAHVDMTALKDTHQQEISQLYMKINLLDNNLIYLTNEKNDLLLQQHQLLQEKERWKMAAATAATTSSQSQASVGSGDTMTSRGMLGMEVKESITKEFEGMKKERLEVMALIDTILAVADHKEGEKEAEVKQSSNESMITKLRRLQHFVTASQEKYRQLLSDHQSLTTTRDESSNQWLQEKSTFEELVNQQRLQYETIVHEKEELLKERQEMREELQELIIKLRSVESQLSAENEKSKLQNELQQAKAQINELQRLLDEVVASKQTIEHHIHGLVEENEQLQQQLQLLSPDKPATDLSVVQSHCAHFMNSTNSQPGLREEELRSYRSSQPLSQQNQSYRQRPTTANQQPQSTQQRPSWSRQWKSDDRSVPSVSTTTNSHQGNATNRQFLPYGGVRVVQNQSTDPHSFRHFHEVSRDRAGSYSSSQGIVDMNPSYISVQEIETSSGRKKFDLLKQKFEDLSR